MLRKPLCASLTRMIAASKANADRQRAEEQRKGWESLKRAASPLSLSTAGASARSRG